MSRLFITEREIRFISDINKELIKDINGQKIYYYPISDLKTLSNDIYNEAIKKIYDQPIIIEALVDAKFHEGTSTNEFGVDNKYTIEVYIQWRDLVEKALDVVVGDAFSYGTVMYEITDRQYISSIFGQIEHKEGVRLVGTRMRKSAFDAPHPGPTDISLSDDVSVQHEFVQQRGTTVDENGDSTGDVRELVRDGVVDPPITGVKKISYKGDEKGKVSSFYGDEE